MTAEKRPSKAKQPDPVDVHVGRRIRARRLLHRISQGDLGAEIGVTFQQVQKYELGANRVSASRLQRLADVLGTNVAYFFEGLEETGARAAEKTRESELLSHMRTPEVLHLNRVFIRIADPQIRRSIVALVIALAEADGDDRASI